MIINIKEILMMVKNNGNTCNLAEVEFFHHSSERPFPPGIMGSQSSASLKSFSDVVGFSKAINIQKE